MTVLDASAVLALIHNEPGSDLVAEQVTHIVLGAANLAEVVGRLVDADIDVARLRELLSAAGVTVEPLSAVDAELAAFCKSRVRGNPPFASCQRHDSATDSPTRTTPNPADVLTSRITPASRD